MKNPVGDDDHTWLDNLVLAVTRGTTYIWMPVNPESLRDHRAAQLQQVMELDLTPHVNLAAADPAAVMNSIESRGFYLQLPPGTQTNTC